MNICAYMNIKNVIFDFGQVIVYFKEKFMVDKYVDNKEDSSLLSEVIFDRLYWDRLDLGTITNEEVVSECKKRLPSRLHDLVDTIYYNWIYNIPLIEGMEDLLLFLKKRGVKIYLLSNISRYLVSNQDKFPIFDLFDGKVFSSELGIVKPDHRIFKYICDKYSLVPSETIFVDDNINNVNSGKDFGLLTYQFDGDASKLKSYLTDIMNLK
jgi:putative hydrolase of the HAD superfamily